MIMPLIILIINIVFLTIHYYNNEFKFNYHKTSVNVNKLYYLGKFEYFFITFKMYSLNIVKAIYIQILIHYIYINKNK